VVSGSPIGHLQVCSLRSSKVSRSSTGMKSFLDLRPPHIPRSGKCSSILSAVGAVRHADAAAAAGGHACGTAFMLAMPVDGARGNRRSAMRRGPGARRRRGGRGGVLFAGLGASGQASAGATLPITAIAGHALAQDAPPI